MLSPPAPSRQSHHRVLVGIVTDDLDSALGVTTSFRAAGVRYLVFESNGAEAILESDCDVVVAWRGVSSDQEASMNNTVRLVKSLRTLGLILPIAIVVPSEIEVAPHNWGKIGVDAFIRLPTEDHLLQEFLNAASPSNMETEDLEKLGNMFVGVLCDDRLTTMVLSTALSKNNVSHHIYSSEALYELVYSQCNVIIINRQLERLICTQAIKLIKQWSSHAGSSAPPLLVISSNTADDGQECIDAGASVFMRKPFGTQRLLQGLVTAFGTGEVPEVLAPLEATTTEAERKSHIGKMQVSVICDNPTTKEHLSTLLKACQAKFTISGSNDISSHSQYQCDALIVDDVFKTGDLATVVEAVRSCGNLTPTLAIVNQDQSSSQRLYDAGVNMLLGKPYTVERFHECLLGLLAQGHRPSQANTKQIIVGIMCDDRVMRRSISMSLRKTGVRCQPLPSDAMRAVACSDCDVVILDSTCHVEDTATLKMLWQCRTRHLPVIVVTSAIGDNLDMWMEEGASALLPRPFHQATLWRVLQEALAAMEPPSQVEPSPGSEHDLSLGDTDKPVLPTMTSVKKGHARSFRRRMIEAKQQDAVYSQSEVQAMGCGMVPIPPQVNSTAPAPARPDLRQGAPSPPQVASPPKIHGGEEHRATPEESRPVREKSEKARKASLIKRPGSFLRITGPPEPSPENGRRSLYLSKEPVCTALAEEEAPESEQEADSLSAWCSLEEPDPTRASEEDEEQDEESSEVPIIAPEGQMHEPCCGLWVAELTQTGYYPGKAHCNQDATVVSWRQGGQPQEHLFSVLDGHGPHGHVVANSVKQRLPSTISRLALRNPNHAGVLQQGYNAVNTMVRNDPAIDDMLSGTTASSVWISGRRAFIANTGDSRTVLGCASESGLIVAMDLTHDQTPFRSDERKRVIRAGARIMTMGERHGECGPLTPEEYNADDPPRCYLQKQAAPGTAFTRSIGDAIAETIGVISTPEVRIHALSENDRFMILATDGVWEFISSQEAVDIVRKCKTPFEAAFKLIEESYKLWMEFDVRTDDISAVVIFFQQSQ